MARQEDACWRCGTEWVSEREPQTRLQLIHGDGQSRDDDRWTNEGGSLAVEVTPPLPAAARS
jgi:hypothetical protein